MHFFSVMYTLLLNIKKKKKKIYIYIGKIKVLFFMLVYIDKKKRLKALIYKTWGELEGVHLKRTPLHEYVHHLEVKTWNQNIEFNQISC